MLLPTVPPETAWQIGLMATRSLLLDSRYILFDCQCILLGLGIYMRTRVLYCMLGVLIVR
jgi:hypothetical protein